MTDEPQYIDYDRMARVAQYVADLATRLGNLDHRPVVDKQKPDPRGDTASSKLRLQLQLNELRAARVKADSCQFTTSGRYWRGSGYRQLPFPPHATSGVPTFAPVNWKPCF